MAIALKTIEQYIVEDRKRETIYIGFNERYAKACLGIKEDSQSKNFKLLDKEMTNWEKREEFIKWMHENYPSVKLTDVFDDVPIGYQIWPFLGTIAIDVEIDSPEYQAITSRYEDETGHAKSLDAVIWIMHYEDAKKLHEKRMAFMEAEFDE